MYTTCVLLQLMNCLIGIVRPVVGCVNVFVLVVLLQQAHPPHRYIPVVESQVDLSESVDVLTSEFLMVGALRYAKRGGCEEMSFRVGSACRMCQWFWMIFLMSLAQWLYSVTKQTLGWVLFDGLSVRSSDLGVLLALWTAWSIDFLG